MANLSTISSLKSWLNHAMRWFNNQPATGSSPPAISPGQSRYCQSNFNTNLGHLEKSDNKSDILSFSDLNIPSSHAGLIYYGYPNLAKKNVSDTTPSLEQSVCLFQPYPFIVFGGGLEETGHPAHLPTTAIIDRLKKAEDKVIAGYIDLGNTQDGRTKSYTIAEIKKRVESWKNMGATHIFFDDAGNDYQVDHQRRTEAIESVHREQLGVIVNAWNLNDIQNAPLNDKDYLLLESLYYDWKKSAGQPVAAVNQRLEIAKRIVKQKQLGIIASAMDLTLDSKGRVQAQLAVFLKTFPKGFIVISDHTYSASGAFQNMVPLLSPPQSRK